MRDAREKPSLLLEIPLTPMIYCLTSSHLEDHNTQSDQEPECKAASFHTMRQLTPITITMFFLFLHLSPREIYR